MTRAIIVAITLLIITVLVINAFKKDEGLPEQTTTIEIREEKEHFEETVEIKAEISEEDPDVRKGSYEFEIDASRFRLDIEYHKNPDIFKITNISDLVSRLQLERTEVPYRVYHDNRVCGAKLWGEGLSHFYYLGYQKRIFKGLWAGPSAGLFINPICVSPMLGITLSFEW